MQPFYLVVRTYLRLLVVAGLAYVAFLILALSVRWPCCQNGPPQPQVSPRHSLSRHLVLAPHLLYSSVIVASTRFLARTHPHISDHTHLRRCTVQRSQIAVCHLLLPPSYEANGQIEKGIRLMEHVVRIKQKILRKGHP